MVPFPAPKRRRIYLMRHGAVTYFDATGRPILPETVPLNEDGRRQAAAAGQTFAAERIVFDRVIVSGLPRTVETAQRVLAEMPAMQARNLALEPWPELQEIRGGKLAEIPEHDVAQAFIGAFEGRVPEDRRFLNGERIGDFLDRVVPAIARLRALPDWDTVLMVLHGGTNRAILSHAITGGERVFFGNLAQTAGCINVLDVGEAPGDWVLRMANFSPPSPAHLGSRLTTMEVLLQQYLRYRQPSA
ncbi:MULTISPECIES: histidine phosphatase family protein [Ralstonia solanacearum species complex]|uniref:Adenosylcobalamin/alpha-ribazole phosphatase n=4 Tax=Ralstonia solanacearum species complex TaxID=3116862 RepID=A0A0K1ZJ62_RALSL|nr:histidine phosphatase family protein [Ralstonia pseudosolanacearum]AKZ26080.1 fructose-2,6-bisphosphatase [Ralstonia solanacearum]AST27566.1 histidine phosphatase family protein [Ralstonia pseudosolanacearum]AST86159.1 histidine phosphatase family protein [Ralstonia pseudosolanacearum]AUS42094.1 histidine phosphatase family protein [Ralstonia solanacearum]AYA46258.1 adenosylcobalamin/alpha-ribazole phosphatase [Ralstonia pseudosolanacearum]